MQFSENTIMKIQFNENTMWFLVKTFQNQLQNTFVENKRVHTLGILEIFR